MVLRHRRRVNSLARWMRLHICDPAFKDRTNPLVWRGFSRLAPHFLIGATDKLGVAQGM
jgi:hypothetical protein